MAAFSEWLPHRPFAFRRRLHGFLSYLVKATVAGLKYSVFGYKGKQVRDNIHSHDVVRAIEAFAANPAPARSTTWVAARKTASP